MGLLLLGMLTSAEVAGAAAGVGARDLESASIVVRRGEETDQAPTTSLIILDSADYGDSNIVMRIEEVERAERTSTLRLTSLKLGSSVGSSLFIMRGFYEVAKARGTEYFTNLKEWDDGRGGRMFVGGFTNTKDPDIPTEFGERFSPTNDFGQARVFMSVSQCDALWGTPDPGTTDPPPAN